MNTSYSIDDGPKISILDGNNPSFNSSAQSSYNYEYVILGNTTTITQTSIDISSLANGAHKLTLYADGFFNANGDFVRNEFTGPYNFSSSAIYFSINYIGTYPTISPNPTVSPTSTVPEFQSWLAILPLLVSLLSVAVIFKFRHRRFYDTQTYPLKAGSKIF